MTNNRNLTLDYARGVAITMILIYHFYGYLERAEDSVVYWAFHTMQLPVFVYISGMLAHSSIDRYGFVELLRNRAIRLLFPFFSFMLIWAVIKPDKFLPTLYDEFKGGYWFIFVLFEMMALLALGKRLATKYRQHSYVVNGALFGLLTLFVVLLPRDNMLSHYLSINLLWHYYPFFLMGYYSYRVQPLLALRWAPVYLVAWLLVQYLFFTTGRNVLTPLCNLFSLLLLMSLFFGGIRPFERIFSYVGVYSLQIYLVHFFLLRLLVPYLPIVGNRWLEFAFLLVLTSSIMAAAIAVSRLLMRNSLLGMLLFGIRRQK